MTKANIVEKQVWLHVFSNYPVAVKRTKAGLDHMTMSRSHDHV